MSRIIGAYQELLRLDAVALSVALVVERILPSQQRTRLGNVLFNTLGYLLILPLLVMAFPYLTTLTGAVREALGGTLLELSSRGPALRQALVGLSVVFAWDFFQYWGHRAMHAVGWLWEIHRLHHSDRAMNASTAFRNHLTAHIFQFLAIGLPLGLLLPISALNAVMWILFFHLWGFINHLNVRVPLRRFTAVLSGPHWHRIHHSTQPEHWNRNYAAFFPVIDILFGTYYCPAQDEFPPTGLGTDDDPNNLRSLTVAPFASWLGSAFTSR